MIVLFKNKKNLINDDRIIAPHIKAKDLDSRNISYVINVFKLRIETFYIKPGNLLINNWNSDYGFMLIAISSILIDLLSQYECGLPSSKDKVFKQFLNTHIKEFKNHFSGGFLIYHDQNGKLQTESASLWTYSKAFYKGFRCGVVHNAMISPYGGYDETPAKLYKEEPWIDSKGVEHNQLVIHPIKLFERVKKIFNEYIKNLQNPKNKLLRQNFKAKFLLDFGYGD